MQKKTISNIKLQKQKKGVLSKNPTQIIF